ncbi:MAG: hypothetical protein GWN67_03180 [Phycisphaerae bacterium]|nr:hypothetical protein [Phycisphaerae bacterium]NIP50963.1 hypothetical protein [Phycisphaerae bacterium]NIS50153.1 hypothetical protein [Phycisphaerae bacterium]NIU07796.1 hypothetical protein [Phycisphaerae bacterium]NIU55419.1 hypothetical protein [Phycisphaerae bacterium]
MRTLKQTVLLFIVLSLCCQCKAEPEKISGQNLLTNGNFEQGLSGWGKLWTRTPGGNASIDNGQFHSGQRSVRIEYSGLQDWSFHQERTLTVEPGQIYEFSGWVRLEGEGTTTLSVTLRGKNDKVIDWTFGAVQSTATDNWRRLKSRFIIPNGGKTILPRLIGYGPAKVWLDDATLNMFGTLDQLRSKKLPETLKVANEVLEVTVRVADAAVSVHDRRTGRKWVQHPSAETVVLNAKADGGGLILRLLEPSSMLNIDVGIRLVPRQSEMIVVIAGQGDLRKTLRLPHPFVTGKGTYLVMPVNEGISYPVDDESLNPMGYHLYGGHGLCMPWYGVTDGQQGIMTIVETPDDAAVRVPRLEGFLCLSPELQPQKGKFGPKRRLRYVFLERGGHVAMCKRYRSYAKRTGLIKTLEQKRKENPNVDLLIGAVNVWCWERDSISIIREMKSLGIDRILWSNRRSPDVIKTMNEMDGVLTSRYDIYQDLMDPEIVKQKLRGLHSDWIQAAWPKDIMLDRNGDWRKGWRVRGKDGKMYPCGVLCDRQALKYARQRVPEELKTHPYRCRFIDTTTASPWRECYDKSHPMTRSESRHWKMELLRFMSEEMKLVTGSETGHDAAVPYVHYFEGMLSLGPYRIPNAGRNMIKPWEEVPERVAKFQVGHKYRLPLWELVYHDCVVAQWYWGDYNNKLPALWDKRDLFNILYGTPPMFMFNNQIWNKNKARFAQSYKNVCPVARAVGYAEMLDHHFLTVDRSVQQTKFANGISVTVNFGDKLYRMPDGKTIEPMGYSVSGM